MNKDKAIQLLERLQDPEPYEPMLTKDAYDAIQMAIDALSADDDTISRKAAIEVIDSFNVFESRCDQIKLEQMIGELPPANCSEIPNGSDTISRQAAIDALRKMQTYKLFSGNDMLLIDQAGAQTELMLLPPAQPEIIRCKDCKHFKQVFAPNDNDGLCGHWHSKYDARTSREGYCSHAERKEATE